jgi:hypothetical protein
VRELEPCGRVRTAHRSLMRRSANRKLGGPWQAPAAIGQEAQPATEGGSSVAGWPSNLGSKKLHRRARNIVSRGRLSPGHEIPSTDGIAGATPSKYEAAHNRSGAFFSKCAGSGPRLKGCEP